MDVDFQVSGEHGVGQGAKAWGFQHEAQWWAAHLRGNRVGGVFWRVGNLGLHTELPCQLGHNEHR